MRKLLGLFLAMAMLYAFAGIGASALTPEEDLQAQGRALVEETLAIFDSKDYTLKCNGETYARQGDRMVIENRQWTKSFLLKLLLGQVEHKVITAEQNLLLFNRRKVYFDTTSIKQGAELPPEVVFGYITDYFGSSKLLEYMTVTVTEEDAYLVVMLHRPYYAGSSAHRYYYLDGQLKRISMGVALPPSYTALMPEFLEVESLVPGADLSKYDTNWMLKLPGSLLTWLGILENL